MAEVFGVAAGACSLTLELVKLIARTNDVYKKYKDLRPALDKFKVTLLSLKEIAARLDTPTPLLPGQEVNGVPSDLISALKQHIVRGTKLIDEMNNRSGFIHLMKKIIQSYSKEIEKINSDLMMHLIVLTTLLVLGINANTSHRGMGVTTGGENNNKAITTVGDRAITSAITTVGEIKKEIAAGSSDISELSEMIRVHAEMRAVTAKLAGLWSGSSRLGLLVEKDIVAHVNKLCDVTKSLFSDHQDLRPLLADLILTLGDYQMFFSDLHVKPLTGVLHLLDGDIRRGISLMEDISVGWGRQSRGSIMLDVYTQDIKKLNERLRMYSLMYQTNVADLMPESVVKMESRLQKLLGGSVETETQQPATAPGTCDPEEEVTGLRNIESKLELLLEESVESRDDEEDRETMCGACGDSNAADDFLICCDICEKWFHGKCVNATTARAERIKPYECPGCSNKRMRLH